ncbi:MAG: sulfatase-like hydrolase/transferase [Planctomycetota bacterium]
MRPVVRRPRSWSQVLLYSVAVVMIVAGAGILLWNHLVVPAAPQITGQVAPELKPVDHIATAPGALRDWNVLIVTIDTTRGDHVGCYGNQGVETPVLDQLAREGVLCANAITPVPATLPGHCSLLTGLYPYNHGARANGSFKLDDEQVTLAEILREQGYRTGAVISAYVLDSDFGLNQGFEVYHDDLTQGVKLAPHMFRERPAELTNEAISDWLREHADERFFCWVHYFDPHALYLAPEPFRSRYARNPYDGEIAYADSQLGRLLDLLSELEVREKTLVVVTADHGEGLGEHNEQTHSLLIYDSTLRVPLILHAPGALPAGQAIDRQVSLVDVVPTVLDLLGLDCPVRPDGVSLLKPGPAEPRACYIETLASKTLHGWAPLLGVRRDDYKFILAPRPEVYDLRRDPRELENLYESHPDIATDFHELLKRFVGEDPLVATNVAENLEMDDEALQRLAALGYVRTVTGDVGDSETLIDPKDGVIHWELVQKGTQLCSVGDIKGAIETLERCIEEVPGDVWARQVLAGAYQTYGRYDDALEVLREAETLAPSDPTIPTAVAGVHVQLRDPDQAEQNIRRTLALQPDNSGAHLQLAHVALLRRQPEEALRLMRKALELDRGSRKAGILNAMGDFHLRRAAIEEARTSFQQALEVDTFSGEARGGLAEILLSEGAEDQALQHLQAAIRFNPVQPRALTVLAGLYSNQGNYEAAIKYCERVLEMSPVCGMAYGNLGLAHRRQGDLAKAEEVYRAGIERCPNYDGLHQNLAQLLLKQDQVEAAAEEFATAARLNPYNVVALANLGTYYVQAAQPELARRFLEQALRVKPDYAFAHKQLGLLLLGAGQGRPGVFHLQRCLELDPNQADAELIRAQLEAYRPPATSAPTEETVEEVENSSDQP